MIESILIRPASDDADVIVIHRFLCMIAGPSLFGPIDPEKSIAEIQRVAQHEAAIMALSDGVLVGSLGIIDGGELWYSKQKILVNRWFFVWPTLRQSGIGNALLDEAHAIADYLERPFFLYKERHKKSKSLCSGEVYEPEPQNVKHIKC